MVGDDDGASGGYGVKEPLEPVMRMMMMIMVMKIMKTMKMMKQMMIVRFTFKVRFKRGWLLLPPKGGVYVDIAKGWSLGWPCAPSASNCTEKIRRYQRTTRAVGSDPPPPQVALPTSSHPANV